MSIHEFKMNTAEIPFGQLLGALLGGIAQAQHVSNHYSSQVLAAQYQPDTLLRYFPVPNGCVTEVEVAVDIGVVGVVDHGVTPESARAGAVEAATSLSLAISDDVIALLKERGGDAARSESGAGEHGEVAQGGAGTFDLQTMEAMRARLARQIGDFARARVVAQGEDAGLDRLSRGIVRIIMESLSASAPAARIVEQGALAERAAGRSAFFERRLLEKVRASVERLPREAARLSQARGTSLVVSTDASGTALPRGQLKIKAHLREHRWTATFDDGETLHPAAQGMLVPLD